MPIHRLINEWKARSVNQRTGGAMPFATNEHEQENGSPRHDPRDEFTLLCERCGYVVEGLDQRGKCPECGTPIDESVPAIARPGSPWQLKPDLATVITTMWAMARRPVSTLDRMRIEDGSWGLGIGMCAVASVALVLPVAVGLLVGEMISEGSRGIGIGALAMGAIITMCAGFAALAGLMLLTYIEQAGIQMYGRVHRRRITRAVAETVCAHACVGWLTGAVLVWMALGVAMLMGDELLGLTLVPVALFLGLLHFEMLVWIGVRRCRYANRERAPFRQVGSTHAASLTD